MTNSFLIAGFGGQGVLFAGKFLVNKGMMEGKEVSWLPSYGPEMRGGTANCCVVLSEKPVGSPVVLNPTELIAMNTPSLIKFEESVVSGGIILLNSSIVDQMPTRTDVKAYKVPCVEIAAEIGNPKTANMAMLGAYLEATKALRFETVHEMLKRVFHGPKEKLIGINIKALEAGAACIK